MHAHATHGHSHGTGRVVRIALAVTMLYVVLLVVAGIRAHSLALLFEAGAQLPHFLAPLLLLGPGFSGRPATKRDQNLWIPARGCAGGAGECPVADGGVASYFLRGVPADTTSPACPRRTDDCGGGGGRGDERRDRIAAVAFAAGRQRPERLAARGR